VFPPAGYRFGASEYVVNLVVMLAPDLRHPAPDHFGLIDSRGSPS
jgi:hypothetical protein